MRKGRKKTGKKKRLKTWEEINMGNKRIENTEVDWVLIHLKKLDQSSKSATMMSAIYQ